MTLLVIELVALAVGVTAELIGVSRRRRGDVDTYTEITRWWRENAGPLGLATLFVILGLLAWAIPHFAELV